MEEQILFENGTVTITQNQFIVEKQTFAMNTITSIKTTETPPSARLSGNTAIIGSLCLFMDELFFFVGLILLAISAILWKNTKPTYSIILNTKKGEVLAFTNKDKDYVAQVFSALNQALMNRE